MPTTSYTLDNATATPIPTVRGTSIAHTKKLRKQVLACKLGQVLLGEVNYTPTMKDLSVSHHCCLQYIMFAKSLPAELRADIVAGKIDPEVFNLLFEMTRVKQIVSAEPTPNPVKLLATA
jgi:hypothetical protein